MGKGAMLKRREGTGESPSASSRSSEPDSGSTEPVAVARSTIMRAAWMRRAGTVLLLAFVAAGALSAFGVDEAKVSSSGAGYELEVEYAAVSRPGLRTPWKIRVERNAGFDGPLELRTNSSYLELFDYHQMYPEPEMQRDGQWTILTFPAPTGDRFEFSFDARLSPSTLQGTSASTAILENGMPVAQVSYRTRVMP